MNNILYRICRHYVNHVNGENNGNMNRNGELRFLREAVPECSIIFDVGANVGEWAALALQINPGINLHCFEPSLKTYTQLRNNFKEGAAHIKLNNFALGAAPEVRSLHLFGDCAGTNSLYQREGLHIHQSAAETIQVVTLDQYCLDEDIAQIDLLKIDVEGHELAVLQGSKQMLQEGRITRIQFEYGGCFIDARILLKDIFNILVPYGFRLYKVHPSRLVAAVRYDQRFENFQYQNWVALKSGAL